VRRTVHKRVAFCDARQATYKWLSHYCQRAAEAGHSEGLDTYRPWPVPDESEDQLFRNSEDPGHLFLGLILWADLMVFLRVIQVFPQVT
jgi:hypothetical protein